MQVTFYLLGPSEVTSPTHVGQAVVIPQNGAGENHADRWPYEPQPRRGLLGWVWSRAADSMMSQRCECSACSRHRGSRQNRKPKSSTKPEDKLELRNKAVDSELFVIKIAWDVVSQPGLWAPGGIWFMGTEARGCPLPLPKPPSSTSCSSWKIRVCNTNRRAPLPWFSKPLWNSNAAFFLATLPYWEFMFVSAPKVSCLLNHWNTYMENPISLHFP